MHAGNSWAELDWTGLNSLAVAGVFSHSSDREGRERNSLSLSLSQLRFSVLPGGQFYNMFLLQVGILSFVGKEICS